MFRIKKELKIKILCILLTGLLLSIAVNLKAAAQQTTTVNVITAVRIAYYTPEENRAFNRYGSTHDADVRAVNNTAGMYDINVAWYTVVAGNMTLINRGQTVQVGPALRLIVKITARDGTIFCENVELFTNGARRENSMVRTITVDEKEIVYTWDLSRVNISSTQPIMQPAPTFHTITIELPDNPVEPSPTPPPTPEPPEKPDLSEYSEIIIYAAELIIHSQKVQTAELKSALEALQNESQNEEIILAIEDQTDEINKTMQHNFNMVIVFSLVTIGAIVGIGFLVSWRPTHD